MSTREEKESIIDRVTNKFLFLNIMSHPFPTPSPSGKRPKHRTKATVIKYDRGNDSVDRAPQIVYKGASPPGVSNAEKFAAVKDNARGRLHGTIFSYVRGKQDQWHAVGSDVNGNILEFFTPRKFKDAEACLFNGKTYDSLSYVDDTLASNGPHFRDVMIDYASVEFEMHNVTQQDTTLEMYICYGKGKNGNALPWEDLNNALAQEKGTPLNIDNVGYEPISVEGWLDKWVVKKVCVKFEPGEKSSYHLKGPRGYALDPRQHMTVGVEPTSAAADWLQPHFEGNGCIVWFRMLNRLTLIATTDLTANTNNQLGGRRIHAHYPENPVPAADGDKQGGIIIKIKQNYQVCAPETYTGGDVRVVNVAFDSGTGGTKSTVIIDTDQTQTLAVTPL